MATVETSKPTKSKSLGEASDVDVRSSATLTAFKNDKRLSGRLIGLLDRRLQGREKMLDLGVGFGFSAQAFKEALGFREVVGLDIDADRLTVARERGIETQNLDLEKSRLPFPDESVDLALCFGLLNYMKSYDNIIGESRRVLKRGGIFVVSVPNLGWWVNRFSLLFGFQPPHIGVSVKHSVGLPDFYPRQKATNYVHSVTLRGLRDLMTAYGFDLLRVFGGHEAGYDDFQNRAIRVLAKTTDAVFSKRTSWTVRLIAVAQKKS